jgi:8-oxo-dGTP pyrophosphatase MutT (NUDIX family)
MQLKQGQDYVGVSVVYFCHDGKGKFIMARRSENARDERGRWDIGGGGLEFGMTVEDTLKKEIREEYCTDVLSYEFLGYRDAHRKLDGKPTHWIALDFKVLVDPSKVAIGEPHKFTDLAWFDFAGKLPVNLHSLLPYFLEKYNKQLRG